MYCSLMASVIQQHLQSRRSQLANFPQAPATEPQSLEAALASWPVGGPGPSLQVTYLSPSKRPFGVPSCILHSCTIQRHTPVSYNPYSNYPTRGRLANEFEVALQRATRQLLLRLVGRLEVVVMPLDGAQGPPHAGLLLLTAAHRAPLCRSGSGAALDGARVVQSVPVAFSTRRSRTISSSAAWLLLLQHRTTHQ